VEEIPMLQNWTFLSRSASSPVTFHFGNLKEQASARVRVEGTYKGMVLRALREEAKALASKSLSAMGAKGISLRGFSRDTYIGTPQMHPDGLVKGSISLVVEGTFRLEHGDHVAWGKDPKIELWYSIEPVDPDV
jgi:hypothetical protein